MNSPTPQLPSHKNLYKSSWMKKISISSTNNFPKPKPSTNKGKNTSKSQKIN